MGERLHTRTRQGSFYLKLMNLKERINKSGLKQKAIAERIGITPEHLNQMINGKIPMSEKIRNDINDLLNKMPV